MIYNLTASPDINVVSNLEVIELELCEESHFSPPHSWKLDLVCNGLVEVGRHSAGLTRLKHTKVQGREVREDNGYF
jgi:hypothetical protein